MIKWIYCGVLIFLSAIAFAAYAIDKKKAKSGGWRISERTLLCLSFFGGAIGGYAAMFACRHKTRNGISIFSTCWGFAGRSRRRWSCLSEKRKGRLSA